MLSVMGVLTLRCKVPKECCLALCHNWNWVFLAGSVMLTVPFNSLALSPLQGLPR
jgi:hypothetical protein